MVLHECPFCHKLFAAQPVSKEQVGSDEVTKWIDVDPIKREHYRRGMFGNLGVVTEPGVRFERIADYPEDFISTSSPTDARIAERNGPSFPLRK